MTAAACQPQPNLDFRKAAFATNAALFFVRDCHQRLGTKNPIASLRWRDYAIRCCIQGEIGAAVVTCGTPRGEIDR